MLICYSGSIATRALSSSPEAAAILKAGNALRSVKGPFRTERREKLACLVVMVKVGAVMLSCCRSADEVDASGRAPGQVRQRMRREVWQGDVTALLQLLHQC